jgi:acetolactate synthase-1/2/3 large subunit
MAGFAAIEASIASGRPQAVICGSGPGTLGVLWAIAAGRSQGARVLVLVPRTPPVLADSVDIQESSYAYPLHAVGAELFDDVIALEHVDQMPRVALRVRQLFARPYGAVVQLTAPTDLLDCVCPPLPDFSRVTIAPAAPSTATIAEVRALLAGPGGPPAFLLGNGAGVFGERLGAVVARWGAVHFATPAAAGAPARLARRRRQRRLRRRPHAPARPRRPLCRRTRHAPGDRFGGR